MLSIRRVFCALVVVSTGISASAHTLGAQAAPAARFKSVVSANPIGLLFDFFNAEYERAMSTTSTVGIGGSTISSTNDYTNESERYANLDVFYRYYPSGSPFEGWNFGAKVGFTSVSGGGSFVGYGFDLNRSWLLGPEKRFYVGTGFGLKRLVGTEDSGGLAVIPTFRIINIGRAF